MNEVIDEGFVWVVCSICNWCNVKLTGSIFDRVLDTTRCGAAKKRTHVHKTFFEEVSVYTRQGLTFPWDYPFCVFSEAKN
jgi:hypothetical protein